jgi:hypothetical protein
MTEYLHTATFTQMFQEIKKRILTKNKSNSEIVALKIENEILKTSMKELVSLSLEMQSDLVKKFDKSKIELITISTSIEAAVKLFDVFKEAIDCATEEIAVFTNEEKSDVAARMFNYDISEVKNLMATFAACSEVLKEM